MLVRHDTTTLRAMECEWIIKSLIKNAPSVTTDIGKTIPQLILQTIEKGKLKAVDLLTGKAIPAKEIYTWHMPVDTIVQYDDAGNTKYMAVQQRRTADNITQIRIFQDWYFDVSSGKLDSRIKWIELLEEIHTSSGIFIGYMPFCRIYY